MTPTRKAAVLLAVAVLYLVLALGAALRWSSGSAVAPLRPDAWSLEADEAAVSGAVAWRALGGAPAPAAVPRARELSVVVRDALGGAPIPDPLLRWNGLPVRTERDGVLSVPGACSGNTAWLEVESPGYQARTVAVDPRVGEVKVALAPLRRVAGRLVDAADEPVQGARVELVQPGSPPLRTRTAPDGCFLLEGWVGTDPATLRASSLLHVTATLALEPGQAAEELRLRLDRGATVRVDLSALEPQELLELTATGTSGRTVRSLSILAIRAARDPGAIPILTLPPGRYELVLAFDGLVVHRSSRRIADDLVLVPEPPETRMLGVVVQDEGGQPLAGALVQVHGDSSVFGPATTDAEGLARLPVGPSCRLELDCTKEGFLKSRQILAVGSTSALVTLRRPVMGTIVVRWGADEGRVDLPAGAELLIELRTGTDELAAGGGAPAGRGGELEIECAMGDFTARVMLSAGRGRELLRSRAVPVQLRPGGATLLHAELVDLPPCGPGCTWPLGAGEEQVGAGLVLVLGAAPPSFSRCACTLDFATLLTDASWPAEPLVLDFCYAPDEPIRRTIEPGPDRSYPLRGLAPGWWRGRLAGAILLLDARQGGTIQLPPRLLDAPAISAPGDGRHQTLAYALSYRAPGGRWIVVQPLDGELGYPALDAPACVRVLSPGACAVTFTTGRELCRDGLGAIAQRLATIDLQVELDSRSLPAGIRGALRCSSGSFFAGSPIRDPWVPLTLDGRGAAVVELFPDAPLEFRIPSASGIEHHRGFVREPITRLVEFP